MKINILLVDDEYNEVKGLVAIMQRDPRLNCAIMTAGDGFEALEKLEHFRADIIITDIGMPEMTGLEFIERVKARNLCKRFIILTGHSNVDYAVKALRLRAIDYVLKPIDKDILTDLLIHQAREIQREAEAEKEQILLKLRQLIYYDEAFEDVFLSVDECQRYMPCENIAVISYQFDGKAPAKDFLAPLRSALQDVFEWVYTVRESDSNGIAAIVNWSDGVDTAQINAALDGHLDALLLRGADLAPVLGISYRSSDPRQIKNLYVNARNSLIMNRYLSIPYSDLDEKAPAPVNLRRLMDCLARDNTEEIDYTIRKFVKRKFHDHADSTEFVRDICACVYRSLRVYLEEFGAEPTCLVDNAVKEPGIPIFVAERLDAVLQKIFECSHLYRSVLENDNFRDGHVYAAWLDQVVEYIETHYVNDISLEDVAEHVKLHPSYLSSAFRKETGVTFIQHLNGVRMRKAKELMRMRKDMTMNEVANAVGYNNERQFFKVFKNTQGITPGQYRSGAH